MRGAAGIGGASSGRWHVEGQGFESVTSPSAGQVLVVPDQAQFDPLPESPEMDLNDLRETGSILSLGDHHLQSPLDRAEQKDGPVVSSLDCRAILVCDRPGESAPVPHSVRHRSVLWRRTVSGTRHSCTVPSNVRHPSLLHGLR